MATTSSGQESNSPNTDAVTTTNTSSEYKWPANLMEEALMLSICTIFSYGMAHVFEIRRQAIENGESLQGVMKDTKESLTPSEVKEFFQQNKSIISKYVSLKFNAIYKASMNECLDILETKQNSANMDRSLVFETYDSENIKKELVFGIFRDSISKRIILYFKGSDTSKDWRVNLDFFQMIDLTVPDVWKNSFEFDHFKIHHGWYGYLFADAKDKSLNPGTTKYIQIVDALKKVLNAHPDHKLYVTGHSLGGTLSLIMSYFLASDPDIPKPISCITFGSPKVGDANFVKVIEHLEKEKVLRFLRFVNNGDEIPNNPYAPAYKHAGIQVTLFRKYAYLFGNIRKPRIEYHGTNENLREKVRHKLRGSKCGAFSASFDHGQSDYLKRLKMAEKYLIEKSLDDLYMDPKLTRYCMDP